MDLTTILAFLKQYSGLGVSLAGLLVITSSLWTPYLSKLKLPSFKKTGAVDPQADLSDVEGLHLLQERAKRSNCPVLKKAVRDVEVNFWNHVDPQAPLEGAK